MAPPKDVYSIVATVRTKESKNLSVSNKTTLDWDLKPIIEGAYFSGPDVLEVPAGATVNYEVTYHPITMTIENNKHLVSFLSVHLICLYTACVCTTNCTGSTCLTGSSSSLQ